MKTLLNIALFIGAIGTFNESDNFLINFIGIACFFALILINAESGTAAEKKTETK